MKKGINNWQVVVTDASGNGVSDYESFISVDLTVDDVSVSTTISEITGSVIDGYYNVQGNILNTGDGRIAFSVPASSNYFISPEFDYFSVDARDIDDVYATVLANIQAPTETDVGGNYSVINFTHKLNDIFDEEYSLSAGEIDGATSISGWSGWEFEVWDSSALTGGASAALFTATPTVVTNDPPVLSVVTPISGDLIPVGREEGRLYCDLKGLDPSGYRKTVKQINIRLTREF